MPPPEKAGIWAPFLTFAIFLLILGPFFFFKILLDDSYSAVNKRDQAKNAMRIRIDKKNKEKASKTKKHFN